MSGLKVEYDGTRDIDIREGGWGAKPFKVRATSESGRVDIPRTTRTWHFKGSDGAEYRIQIQETGDSNA